jgi:hypothetical protein
MKQIDISSHICAYIKIPLNLLALIGPRHLFLSRVVLSILQLLILSCFYMLL